MVIVEPGSLNSQSQPRGLLDQFETLWLRGEIPDLTIYLNPTSVFDVDVWHDLIELDLEYRWKRFHGAVTKAERDQYGFPQFPRLEDYAALLAESDRHLILTPELLAEEYRVRRTWGDRPDKKDYLERLPLDSVAVESALNQIDTEFEIERATPVDQEESSQLADESTWLVRKQSRQGSRPDNEIEVPRIIGKYELVTLLGRGGFGEVWKAYDPDLNRHVAIKIPRRDQRHSSEALELFRSEARKMATLERVAGTVPVYEVGESDGVVYIVSYLVQGEDLGKLSHRRKLSYEESARIVGQVAETLHRAHLKNLFHRDVKLSNILVSEEGEIFLSDFGLCVSEQEQLKEGHSTTGTYAYMAPEQIRGYSHRLDGRADIYSLGVVLYRLLTGRLPYLAETHQEYQDQILYREPRPLRSIKDDIPAALERICLKCLNKDVKDRYTTAKDLAGDLQRFVRRRKRPWVPAVVVTSALLLVMLVASVALRPAPDPPDPAPRSGLAGSRVIAWDPMDDRVDRIGYSEEDGLYHFDTNDYSLIQVGEIRQQVVTLRTRIRITGNGIGQAGIFWGLDEVVGENRFEKIKMCAWAVQVGKLSRSEQPYLDVKQVHLMSAHGRKTVQRHISLERFTRPNDQPETLIDLEVRVTQHEILSITVNGDALLEAPHILEWPYTLEWDAWQGAGYGFLGIEGSFAVEEFSAEYE